MTRVKVTYVAIDEDGNKPITTADTFDNLRLALDEYYAVGNNQAQCLGFTPYETKYPDEYEGYYQYTYKYKYNNTTQSDEQLTDKIRVYCIEFYPHTVYDIDNTPEQIN
jgi:hypothetical protein